MSNAVKLSNYTDFDRLLIPKNFIMTLLGTAGAFILAFLPVYVELPVVPYNLLLASALMIFVSVYTANIASSALVALGGSLGYTSSDGFVDFFMGYLVVNLLLCVLLGYYADKLQLIMHWTRFYLLFSALISIISIGIGILANPSADLYYKLVVNVGVGGDLGTGAGYPVLDLAVLGGLLLLILIFALVLRGQIQLQKGAKTKYQVFGGIFFLLGQAAIIAPLLLFSIRLPADALLSILPFDSNLPLYQELFFHGDLMGVYGEPLSIFLLIAVSTTFTMLGLSLLMIAKHGGNLEGRKGGADVSFMAAPIALVLFFVFASYPIQNLIVPGGLFLSYQGYFVFAAGLWTTYFLGQLAARVLLFVFRA